MSLEKFNKSIDSFLDGKFARLTKTHKICIAVAIFLVPAALFYYLSFSPKAEEIGRLEKTKRGLEAEIVTLQKKTANIEEFRKEKRLAEEKFAAISVLLPQEKEIPSLLTNISGLGTSSGLDFLSFRPKAEIPVEFYAEIPVDIQVQGQYHSVGRFLDQISKLPRIVNVSNIKMGSPKRQGNEMTLSTSFNLVTYRFIEQTAKNDKSKSKRKR
jgi:type IV pilus assembly protein PilO